MAADGSLEPLVATDLDLSNMFGNVEWPRIRQALRTHFPEASAWIEWQHQSDATNRGAEQGDVLGTIQSALVLATRVTPTWAIRSPILSRLGASATNGSLTTGKSSPSACMSEFVE